MLNILLILEMAGFAGLPRFVFELTKSLLCQPSITYFIPFLPTSCLMTGDFAEALAVLEHL